LLCAGLLFCPPSQAVSAPEPGLETALAVFGLGFSGAVKCVLDREYRRGDCGGGRTCFSTLTADCGDARLRLELVSGIGEASAQKLTAARFDRIRALYSGHMEYPGVITSKVQVPAELRASYDPAGPGGAGVLYMPATARFAYGPGTRDLVAYSAAMSSMYCRVSRSLAQVEVFLSTGAARQDFAALLSAPACLGSPEKNNGNNPGPRP
jgi:hypothetical protein